MNSSVKSSNDIINRNNLMLNELLQNIKDKKVILYENIIEIINRL